MLGVSYPKSLTSFQTFEKASVSPTLRSHRRAKERFDTSKGIKRGTGGEVSRRCMKDSRCSNLCNSGRIQDDHRTGTSAAPLEQNSDRPWLLQVQEEVARQAQERRMARRWVQSAQRAPEIRQSQPTGTRCLRKEKSLLSQSGNVRVCTQ